MEFLKARVWTAVSLGSAASLMLIGFTAVYREGFETVLFYQALFSFGRDSACWILLGFGLGVVVLAAVTYAIFKLGRRLPVKAFLSFAVVLLMATSIAFLGNAVYELQTADIIGYHPLVGWPRLPIYLAQAIGYCPMRETVFAQVALLGGLPDRRAVDVRDPPRDARRRARRRRRLASTASGRVRNRVPGTGPRARRGTT